MLQSGRWKGYLVTEQDLETAINTVNTWDFIQKIGGLFVVLGVVAELMGHIISSPAQKKIDEHRTSEISRLNSEAAASKERSLILETNLIEEKKKREPRELSEQQKSIISEELAGKISNITFVVQKDVESELFSMRLLLAIPKGISISKVEMPPGENLGIITGLLVFIPGGTGNTVDAEKDPVYGSLKKAGFQVGVTNTLTPWSPLNTQLAETLGLSSGMHIVFVLQKPLF